MEDNNDQPTPVERSPESTPANPAAAQPPAIKIDDSNVIRMGR